ncbi:MAG: A/G-specific adenine glycosylase [Gammaproteobacteria bacterium]|nr:A/G-specific adenine glycosylase [Gammaproteobacteria bacterium]
MNPESFSTGLLAWYDRHGRKDLPWTQSRDPYRVWVSEIMLQQTQVATVIPYYERFLARFPDVAALAHADLDEVLHLWTGLGYYARARNLKRAAETIVTEHAGRFPTDIEQVRALPGIGRSTAGAILAFAFDQHHAILDGNVKRVLARYHAVAARPGATLDKALWPLAEAHTPAARCAEYTQAIMDLGATLCRRGRPQCADCPLASGCAAFAQGTPEAYPAARARRALPTKHVVMLMIRDGAGRVLLQQRPPAGIWGGLWGFPECAVDSDARKFSREQLGLNIELEPSWPSLPHTFSHFHLAITPQPARVVEAGGQAMENNGTVWYRLDAPDARGLAAPVQRLLQQLQGAR